MKLSRRVLDAYNAAIKKQGDNAEDAARKALEAWFDENPDATVADAREFSIALMREVGTFYGNAAGDVACSLRDMAAEAAGVELPPVDYEYAPEAEYVEKAGHRQAGKLVEGNRPGFVDGIAKSSRYFAERGANDTMAALGLADGKRLGKRVRFARVPTGDTTCPYCCMLASRGFVYHSELKALNANHQNCDCRIVEGFKGMEVEGYDPDLYYDMWKNPEKYKEEQSTIAVSSISAERSIRGMANSQRQSPFHVLDTQEIEYIESEARRIEIPIDILSFNTGSSTSYDDGTGRINVRGDVFPDKNSTENRDAMSEAAVLAHEYYGHRKYSGTSLEPGDWRDEFRASYRAALDTPGLTDEERACLMIDAYQRAVEAGVKLKYSSDYRRIVYGYEPGSE